MNNIKPNNKYLCHIGDTELRFYNSLNKKFIRLRNCIVEIYFYKYKIKDKHRNCDYGSILACVKYGGEFYFLHLCPDYMFSDNILKFYKICRINNEKY